MFEEPSCKVGHTFPAPALLGCSCRREAMWEGSLLPKRKRAAAAVAEPSATLDEHAVEENIGVPEVRQGLCSLETGECLGPSAAG